MSTSQKFSVNKKSETGSIILILLLVLLFIGAVAAYFVYKTINKGEQRVAQNASEYQNPFNEQSATSSKSAQYVNPFSDYKNPFNDLK